MMSLASSVVCGVGACLCVLWRVLKRPRGCRLPASFFFSGETRQTNWRIHDLLSRCPRPPFQPFRMIPLPSLLQVHFAPRVIRCVGVQKQNSPIPIGLVSLCTNTYSCTLVRTLLPIDLLSPRAFPVLPHIIRRIDVEHSRRSVQIKPMDGREWGEHCTKGASYK